MKVKVTAKDVVKPVVVLFLICLIVSVLLAFTNQLTKAKIVEINKQTEQQSQQQVLPNADSFEPKTSQGLNYAVGKKGGEVAGYVFTTSSKSYGGDVKVMTGISKDGKVTGVNLVQTNDTPGLGLNAQKASFRDQFKQAVPASGKFDVNKNGQTGNGQIAALTGATITSKAVADAVNQAVASFNTVKGGA